jgi:hypothetical protein
MILVESNQMQFWQSRDVFLCWQENNLPKGNKNCAALALDDGKVMGPAA